MLTSDSRSRREAILFVGTVALTVVLTATISLSAFADDPLLANDPGLDPQKMYQSGLEAETVDLFRGMVRLDYTDVSLPGRNGLGITIQRWYTNKALDEFTSATGQWMPLLDSPEILGLNWRLHMGRYLQTTASPTEPETPDYLELPGGRHILFFERPVSTLPPAFPLSWLNQQVTSSNYSCQIGPDYWLALVPTYPNQHPLYVLSPDGLIYTFAIDKRISVLGGIQWNCTSIRRGDAQITIEYIPFPQVPKYAYISKVSDGCGREANFTYFDNTSNDPNDMIVNALTKITFPLPGGATGTIRYDYAFGGTYPLESRSSMNNWPGQQLNNNLDQPAPVDIGPYSYYVLGRVRPPAGTDFATEYQYFRESSNMLANIKLPNGTVTGYEYARVQRNDFAGGAGCTCYVALTKRGVKGDVLAGRATPGSETRTWLYGYASVGSLYNGTGEWVVTITTPLNTREEVHFNAMTPYAVEDCPTGDCPQNGNTQRWRAGLLLKQLVYDGTTLLEETEFSYDRLIFNNFICWHNPDKTYNEKGFTPIPLSQKRTRHFPGTSTTLSTETISPIASYDQYGNPGEATQRGFGGEVLRSTTTEFAWANAGNAELLKRWYVHLPETVSMLSPSAVVLQKTWMRYYQTGNYAGFLARSRTWVDDDGSGSPSPGYWAGEEHSYSTDTGSLDVHATTLGFLNGVPVGGSPLNYSLTSYRLTTEKSQFGTPKSRAVSGPGGTPIAVAFDRTLLDARSLAPVSETVDSPTQYGYDTQGRLTSVTPSQYTDSHGQIRTPRSTTFAYTPSTILSAAHAEGQVDAKTTVYAFDGFGSLTRKSRALDATHTVLEDMQTDALGRTATKYLPSFTAGGRGQIAFTYDALGRPLTVEQKPTGTSTESTVSYAYNVANGLAHVIITSPKSDAGAGALTSEEWRDADGNLTRLKDTSGTEHVYFYNSLNQLIRIESQGQLREFSHNNQGQLLWSKIPETNGVKTEFNFDHQGNLATRRAPDGDTVTYAYDFAGRLTDVHFGDGSHVANYYGTNPPPAPQPDWPPVCAGSAYNSALHLLTQINYGANAVPVHCICNDYDALGRAFKRRTIALSQETDVLYGFNELGALERTTYPSGRTVTAQSFNLMGLPGKLVDNDGNTVADQMIYGPGLSLSSYAVPGGKAVTFTEDNLGKLQGISVGDGGGTLFSDVLEYFPSGSLKSQNMLYGAPTGASTSVNHNYVYDSLHRLTGVPTTGTTSTGPFSASIAYLYDSRGNLTQRTSAGFPNSHSLSLSESFATNNRKANGSYDGRGNLIGSIGSPLMAFNDLNQVANAGPDFTYEYDPQGRRLASIIGFARERTVFTYDEAGGLLSEMRNHIPFGDPLVPVHEYIYAGGRMIAMWTADEPYCLDLAVTPMAPQVGGTIQSDPDRLCYSSREEAMVQLMAVPNPGFHFASWSINGEKSSENPARFAMDGAKTAVAAFGHEIYCIETHVEPEGTGTIALTPEGGCYDSFTELTATATPEPGYRFDHWLLNGVSVTDATLHFRLGGNKDLFAVFASNCPVLPPLSGFSGADRHRDASDAYRIALSWNHDVCPYTVLYEILYRETNTLPWLSIGTVAAQQNGSSAWEFVCEVPHGCRSYDFQARSFSPATGTFGTWSPVASATATATFPSQPIGGTYQRSRLGDRIRWTVTTEEACAYSSFAVYAYQSDGTPVPPPQSPRIYNAVNGQTEYGPSLYPGSGGSSTWTYAAACRIGQAESAQTPLGPYVSLTTPPLTLSPGALVIPETAAGEASALDLTGDGFPDLMMPQAFFTGNGDGSFGDASALLPNLADKGTLLAIADADGDGYLDRILAGNATLWVEWNESVARSAAGFFPGASIRLDRKPKSIAGGPLPGGPGCAIAVLYDDGLVLYRLADRGSPWVPEASIRQPEGCKAVALADIGSDGRLDLIVGGSWGASLLSCHPGSGAWLEEPLPATAPVFGITAADANGDNLTDIALAQEPDEQGPPAPIVYLYTPSSALPGEGNPLPPHNWIATGIEEDVSVPGPRRVLFCDLMGAGRPGLTVVSQASGKSVFLRNNGLGGMLASGLELPGKVLNVLSGDFNGDNWPDLAVVEKRAIRLYLSENVPERNGERPMATLLTVSGQGAGQGTAIAMGGGLAAATTSTAASSVAVVGTCPATEEKGVAAPAMAASQKMRSLGYAETSWASAAVFYVEPDSAMSAMLKARSAMRLAPVSGTYLYPVPDVTGTPRVWVDSAGRIVSRRAVGPYGEELGLYSEPEYSGVGYAGYVQDTEAGFGLSYTPNRYLRGPEARFLSIDPSDSFSLYDPRTFNQYAYVAGNPLTFIDPSGLVIVEEESALSSGHYRKIRDEFLSTPAGKAEWEKWDKRTDLTIHMRFTNQSYASYTETKNFQYEKDKLISADIVFFPGSGAAPDPSRSDWYRFGATLTSRLDLILYLFSHEFGHVAHAETAEGASLHGVANNYGRQQAEWKQAHPQAPAAQFFKDRPDLAEVFRTQLGSHFSSVCEPVADAYAEHFFISNGLRTGPTGGAK